VIAERHCNSQEDVDEKGRMKAKRRRGLVNSTFARLRLGYSEDHLLLGKTGETPLKVSN